MDKLGVQIGTLQVLFKHHDDYEVIFTTFICNLDAKEPKFGIKPKTWKTALRIKVYDAFGAPGHEDVHAGLLITYCSATKEGHVIAISIDLAAVDANSDGQDSTLKWDQECALVHTLRVAAETEIDMNIWKYRRTVQAPLLDLFKVDVTRAMKLGHKRGPYNIAFNNCIHFKNDFLKSLGRHREETS